MSKGREQRVEQHITWPIPCLDCGEGHVRPQARPGRTTTFRGIANLPLPTELAIPTCDHCGSEWIDASTALRIDHALEPIYRDQLRGFVAGWIERLAAAKITQSRLEKLLGLSRGYLSKVRTGARSPSPALVFLLKLLAQDPERRLREVEAGMSG